MKTMTRGRFWSVFLALVLVRGMAVAQVAGPDTIRVVYPNDTVAVRLHTADPADPTLQSLWEADPTPTLSKAQAQGEGEAAKARLEPVATRGEAGDVAGPGTAGSRTGL